MTRGIAGIAVLVLLGGAGQTHAEIYTVTDLGDLGGGWCFPTAINSSGQVVGMTIGTSTQAFFYSDGVAQYLGGLPDHQYTRAVGINDAGQAVGMSMLDDRPESASTARPVLYSGGTVTSLGSLGGGYGFANGINNAGQVVGLSSDVNGVTQAFLWSDGAMRNIDAVPGGYSDAYAINDNGQVVGTMARQNLVRGFIWEDNGQGMIDLGALAGGTSGTLRVRYQQHRAGGGRELG